MCEVLYVDMTPHVTNNRAKLAPIAEKFAGQEPLFGIEQEYNFFQDGRPFGFPVGGFPAPQGFYYCGIGADEVFGREIVEAHIDACIEAGIGISGINAEVMPGQWEFQVGPLSPLDVSDQLWVARWLLYRIAEDFGIAVTISPKPVSGDWNGAGAHTNFSTNGDARRATTRSSRRARRSASGSTSTSRATATASSSGSPASTRPRRTTCTATACRTAVRRSGSRGRSRRTRRATSRTVARTPTWTRTW